MSKRTKIVAIIMATMMTIGMTGCGGSKSSGKEKLTVWSHLKTEENEAIQKLASDWGEKNNFEVKVVEDSGKMQDYKEAANSPSGPDVYYGSPHDNLGAFQKADLVSEVPSGMINESDYTAKNVIDAVTINGKKYGLPIAQEAIGLFYNKKLVKEAPKTMEEVVSIGKEKGFKFNVTDFYLTYGLITADGGYIFKNNNGTLDTKDLGLNTPGTVAGYQFIRDLVTKEKLMTADINDDIAKDEFKQGKTAFYISGPWNVQEVKDAGIDLGVCAIPTLNGKTVTPFLGVQTAFVNKNSTKQEKSWDLIKYLNENNTEILVEKGNRIPVTKSGQDSDIFKNNTNISVFANSAKNAIPMPNIPEVQAIWDPAKNNIKSMIAGDIDAQTTAKNIYDQVVEGIKQMK
jgi:arabinogalactan oligomer/maltooligosaccharide transport system substrate-binding protein